MYNILFLIYLCSLLYNILFYVGIFVLIFRFIVCIDKKIHMCWSFYCSQLLSPNTHKDGGGGVLLPGSGTMIPTFEPTPRVWSGIPRVWIFSISVWLLTRNPDLWAGLVYWHKVPETLVIYRININKSGTRGQASNGMREILALHWQPSTQTHKPTDGLADERRDRQSEDGRRTTDGGRTDGRRTADGRRMDSRTDKRTNGRQTNGQMDEQTKRQMKKLRVLYHCRIYMMTLYTRF